MRSRSAAGLHQARIGIKRLRYTVENFLPRQHAEWGRDLKEMQDLLGEIHDLDVLWHTALHIHAFPDVDAPSRWHKTILEARDQHLDRYRAAMTGRQSLWQRWRSELPAGQQIQSAALNRLKVWATFLDSDFQKSQHAANLSLQLFHGLSAHSLVPAGHARNLELILEVAALARNVGRDPGQRVRPKASARRLASMRVPLGWSHEDVQLAAAVVRYHYKRLPAAKQRCGHWLCRTAVPSSSSPETPHCIRPRPRLLRARHADHGRGEEFAALPVRSRLLRFGPNGPGDRSGTLTCSKALCDARSWCGPCVGPSKQKNQSIINRSLPQSPNCD